MRVNPGTANKKTARGGLFSDRKFLPLLAFASSKTASVEVARFPPEAALVYSPYTPEDMVIVILTIERHLNEVIDIRRPGA